MRQRALLALSVPLGLVTGHGAAYAVAPHHATTEAAAHGHLPSLWTVAVPLAVAALVATVRLGARRASFTPRTAELAAALVATYAGMEIVEHLAAGVGLIEVLSAPTLAAGVAAQLLVAAALGALLRAGHRLGRWLATPAPAPAGGPEGRLVARPDAPTWTLAGGAVRPRGPPAPVPA